MLCYAFKRGDYQQCLQLSTQNVHKLLFSLYIPAIVLYPEFTQLLDDDIVSLIAVTVITNPACIGNITRYSSISQLTLSLYLMTQCQLKLRHSVTSLAQTLHYIKVARMKIPRDRTLNHLTLSLIERKVHGSV